MSEMNIAILVVVGLCLGSFVNALVWRIHMQDSNKKSSNKKPLPAEQELSITKGRSMCPHCKHELAPKDLIPVVSWLLLRGKCRYCKELIAWQYPAVELATASLFLFSYVYWPMDWTTAGKVNFVTWLIILVGFIALLVYDFRWMLLPNRIIYPLAVLALILGLYNVYVDIFTWTGLLFGVGIGGGLFWLLFTLSDGKWIGGGDVKLGLLIGLILGDPYQAFLMLMTASILGTLVVVPGMLLKKVKPSSRIPFGPFLIVAAIVVQLFGASIIAVYKRSLILAV